MTKILIDLATAQQALVTLENVNPSLVCEMAHHPKKDQHGIGQKCPLEIRHLETITAIKEVLAQPVQPVQEPVAWVAEVELNAAKRSNQEKFMVELWKKRLYASDIALYCIKESK